MGSKEFDVRESLIALYNDEMDEGAVFVSDDFSMMDSLQQADLLQDWKAQLDEMYDSVTSGTFLQDLAPARFNKRLN